MAKQQDTGIVDIQLAKAIKIDGVDVKTLRMREPTVADQLVAQKASGDQAEQELAFIANLCQVAPGDLHQLTLRDYKKVQAAFLGFIG